MMSDLHPIVSLCLLLGMVDSFIWILAESLRRVSARGTRPRWVAAGWERATRYPAGVYLFLSALVSLRYDDYLFFAVQGLGVALWISLLVEKRNGDQDDDFWSSVGDSIRGALGLKSATGSA